MEQSEKLCLPEFNGKLTGTSEYVASAEWIIEFFKIVTYVTICFLYLLHICNTNFKNDNYVKRYFEDR